MLLLVALSVLASGPASALDRVVFHRDGRAQTIRGRVVVTAQDGGVLVMTPAGVLWTIAPDEIIEHTQDAQPFEPLAAPQVEAALLGELPAGAGIHRTAHYVIGYNTSRAYARWCGGLLERLYGAFLNFWQRRGLNVHDPELPLVALLFSDASSYRQYARDELGAGAGSIVGYYSLRSNRMTSYDLTGVQALRHPPARRGSAVEINQTLSQPAAEPLVATVIHEATHQITFNCGLLTRYADIPLWVSEGIAVYFETPDLTSSTGWRGIGQVKRSRLDAFRRNLPNRDSRSLERLIADDSRLRNVRTAAAAYAEAWALNDFLIRRYARQYLKYLTMLSQKKELVWDDPETRLAEFRQYFGEDLEQLDGHFLRHVQKLLQKTR